MAAIGQSIVIIHNTNDLPDTNSNHGGSSKNNDFRRSDSAVSLLSGKEIIGFLIDDPMDMNMNMSLPLPQNPSSWKTFLLLPCVCKYDKYAQTLAECEWLIH